MAVWARWRRNAMNLVGADVLYAWAFPVAEEDEKIRHEAFAVEYEEVALLLVSLDADFSHPGERCDRTSWSGRREQGGGFWVQRASRGSLASGQLFGQVKGVFDDLCESWQRSQNKHPRPARKLNSPAPTMHQMSESATSIVHASASFTEPSKAMFGADAGRLAAIAFERPSAGPALDNDCPRFLPFCA